MGRRAPLTSWRRRGEPDEESGDGLGRDPEGGVGGWHGGTVGRGIDGGRQDDIGRDAGVDVFGGDDLHEGVEGGLGSGVGGEAGGHGDGGAGADGDEAAATLGDHGRQGRAEERECGAGIEVHHAVPRIEGRILGGAAGVEASHEVHRCIECGASGEDGRDGSGGAGWVREIGGDG